MAHANVRGLRVLAVDDDAFLRRILRRLLERAGCEATIVASASEGLAVIEAPLPAPDVVLTDLELPDMSGYDLIRRLRARWPDLPVALMSGKPQDQVAADASPRIPFLLKPYDFEQLMAVLDELVASRPSKPSDPAR